MNERSELVELLTSADLAEALIATGWAKAKPRCDHDWFFIAAREGSGDETESRRCRKCVCQQTRRVGGYGWPHTD